MQAEQHAHMCTHTLQSGNMPAAVNQTLRTGTQRSCLMQLGLPQPVLCDRVAATAEAGHDKEQHDLHERHKLCDRSICARTHTILLNAN